MDTKVGVGDGMIVGAGVGVVIGVGVVTVEVGVGVLVGVGVFVGVGVTVGVGVRVGVVYLHPLFHSVLPVGVQLRALSGCGGMMSPHLIPAFFNACAYA